MDKEYTGEWFLHGNENLIPGKLKINEESKSINLELYTNVYLTGELINFKIRDNEQRHFNIILGNNPWIITLYNCNWSRSERIGKSLYKLEYYVEFAFFNAHLKDTFLVNKLEVVFPFLPSFFDGWQSIKQKEVNKESISYSDYSAITEEIQFRQIDRFFKSKINFSDGTYELRYKKSLEFYFPQEMGIRNVFDILFKFSRFLSFTTNEEMFYKIQTVYLNKNHASKINERLVVKGEDVPLIVHNFSAHKSGDVNKKELHQNMMLFSAWTFDKNQIQEFIMHWYKNENMQHIYDFYLDAINWFKGKGIGVSNVMFNNKFLNLIQGLESYYDLLDLVYQANNDEFTRNRQKVLTALNDEDLKDWFLDNVKFPKEATLKNKLEILRDKFSEIFENVEGLDNLINDYPHKAKEYRHKLSHGNINRTFQGEEFHTMYEFSKILLCFCILESLGFNNNQIKRVCRSHYYLNDSFAMLLRG
ncbi:MAG: ApeA N-terminal domain 1-containing protein [bacterium]